MTLAVMAERNVNFFMGFILFLVFRCELAAIQSDETAERPFKSSQSIFHAPNSFTCQIKYPSIGELPILRT